MTMMEHDKPLVGSRRRFTEEFKTDAPALVLNGERSISRFVRDLGISRYGPGEPRRRVSGVTSRLRRFPSRSGGMVSSPIPRLLGHLSNRSASLQNDPYSTGLELRVILSSYLRCHVWS